MKDDRIFVDTNIFIYASLEERQQGDKRSKAINLFRSLSDKNVFISTQVLHEFYSVMLRHGVDEKLIQDKLDVITGETKLSVIKLKTVKLC